MIRTKKMHQNDVIRFQAGIEKLSIKNLDIILKVFFPFFLINCANQIKTKRIHLQLTRQKRKFDY
jgi:hypothetical protein